MPHTQHPIELLRFNTCGSVDDGKSVVVVNAPRGWQNTAPPVLQNNRNHLGEKAP